ncbi:toxin-antitoxin system YwqK family antitoxin [Paracoccus sp. Ld10]|uniref:toxin-antitoxin system YwqK family antitoxin n=1 Tax=Paracoccus sp. Ld10 TaxID=649158 RepID=UPI003867F4FC
MIQYTSSVVENTTGAVPRTLCHRSAVFEAATIDFMEDGILSRREWWVAGKKHREDGPAVIFYRDGRPNNEEWWRDGKMHRDHGPADTFYNEDGSVRHEVWVRNGRDYTPSGHDRLTWIAASRQKPPE